MSKGGRQHGVMYVEEEDARQACVVCVFLFCCEIIARLGLAGVGRGGRAAFANSAFLLEPKSRSSRGVVNHETVLGGTKEVFPGYPHPRRPFTPL